MKKNILRENIDGIKEISKKMPKTINEALNFNECGFNEEDMENQEDFVTNNERLNPTEMNHSDNLDVAKFIDDIRKKALRGMAQLADNPESDEYQLLKKVWMVCDRKPESQNPNKN